ncbi:MAG: 2-isopropylmalate synthase [Candidatus Sumerlaeota bacterium]|nr:2-isopropylmalate synthase [Candidatus Sumerlaeota bacterium]
MCAQSSSTIRPQSPKAARQPFFYDITLRDGNQALRKPWNTQEKEVVFRRLLELGVQGVEVGFSGASDMDFEACAALSEIAPKDVVISGLARAMERDIRKVAEAIVKAPRQRIHTFIAMSPFNMENVLRKKPEDVARIAVEAVGIAASFMKPHGGEVQFSAEHFGDCGENLPWVIETFQRVIAAGATVINLPNTVERTRPSAFVAMVKQVVKALPKHVTVAVHCHNDLGMASATTVESYFAGARQLECSLNGLGERAGNTNIFEVAVALHNCGVAAPLNMKAIYPIALEVSEMSGVPIHQKAALIGADAMAHRSGIHQDGATKTKDMEKGAYRPIHPSLIGREGAEFLGFTSQSGKTAVYEIIKSAGWPITIEEAAELQPRLKSLSETKGELPLDVIIRTYRDAINTVAGPFQFLDMKRVLESELAQGREKYVFRFKQEGKEMEAAGEGDGPIDATFNALKSIGFALELTHYQQVALAEERDGAAAEAMSVMRLRRPGGKDEILCRGIDTDTRRANVKAIFNGLNRLVR